MAGTIIPDNQNRKERLFLTFKYDKIEDLESTTDAAFQYFNSEVSVVLFGSSIFYAVKSTTLFKIIDKHT